MTNKTLPVGVWLVQEPEPRTYGDQSMTSTNLPVGVWRDDKEAGKRLCPELLRCDAFCTGSLCNGIREYRRPDNTSVQQDGTQPPPDGYYCGKAGKP